MIQPPFPSTIRAQLCHGTFLTAVRKNQENDGQMGSPCLDKPVLAQGGVYTFDSDQRSDFAAGYKKCGMQRWMCRPGNVGSLARQVEVEQYT